MTNKMFSEEKLPQAGRKNIGKSYFHSNTSYAFENSKTA